MHRRELQRARPLLDMHLKEKVLAQPEGFKVSQIDNGAEGGATDFAICDRPAANPTSEY